MNFQLLEERVLTPRKIPEREKKMVDACIKQSAKKYSGKKDFGGEIYPDPKPIESKSYEGSEVGLSQHWGRGYSAPKPYKNNPYGGKTRTTPQSHRGEISWAVKKCGSVYLFI